MTKVSDHRTSKSAEHLTPPHIVRAVLRVLGEIDLDPCAERANEHNVPAKKHFSIGDCSLQREWQGRVYMNPPYGKTSDDPVQAWMEKIAGEIRSGRVQEAIVLWRASTDTDAWVIITEVTEKICMIHHRLTFGAETNTGPAPFPSIAFYHGPKANLFHKVFMKLGQIWDCPKVGGQAPIRMWEKDLAFREAEHAG